MTVGVVELLGTGMILAGGVEWLANGVGELGSIGLSIANLEAAVLPVLEPSTGKIQVTNQRATLPPALYTDRRSSTLIVPRSDGPEKTFSEDEQVPFRPRPFLGRTSTRDPLRFFPSLRCSAPPPPRCGRTSARQPGQNTAEMGRNAEQPRVALGGGGERSAPPFRPPSPTRYRLTIRIKSRLPRRRAVSCSRFPISLAPGFSQCLCVRTGTTALAVTMQ